MISCRLLALGFVVTATACSTNISFSPSPPDLSGSLQTSDLSPSFSAQDYGDGSGIHVYAALLGPNGDFVQLNAGDAFTATDGSRANPLQLEPDPTGDGTLHYTTLFEGSADPSPITLAFTRSTGVSATGSSTVVPARFTILTPPSAQITASQTIAIAVSPTPTMPAVGSGESWQITATGDCINDFIASTSGESLTIDAGGHLVVDTRGIVAVTPLPGQSVPSSCALTVLVRHEHYGPDDSAFAQPIVDDSVVVGNAPQGMTWSFEGVQARAWDTMLVL